MESKALDFQVGIFWYHLLALTANA